MPAATIFSPNANKPRYIGANPQHPLTAQLGSIVLCDDCGCLCFTGQTALVACRNDIKAKKRICVACQTTDPNGAVVEYIN